VSRLERTWRIAATLLPSRLYGAFTLRMRNAYGRRVMLKGVEIPSWFRLSLAGALLIAPLAAALAVLAWVFCNLTRELRSRRRR
jgi:S-adenosylhomocysteine hydrolase